LFKFKLGRRNEDEQSKVPLVLNLKIVGTPAFATVCLGDYPPLAVISIICLSPVVAEFSILTLSTDALINFNITQIFLYP
jgi:hypothetical protein